MMNMAMIKRIMQTKNLARDWQIYHMAVDDPNDPAARFCSVFN